MLSKGSSSNVGASGEARVAQWLKQEGFKVVACNYRRPYGEIDIIAQQGNVLAFVEVKARSNAHFDVTEVITKAKQRRIIRTAHAYLREHGYDEKIYRFDVAIIENIEQNTILYLPNAFTEDIR